MVQLINQALEKKYKTIDNRPLYRIVWSDKQFENRLGIYRDFTESGLFIREIKEVRLTKKYNYIKERWIFEKWGPGNLTANPETPDAVNGDYIPVYVFEDKDGNFLPVTQKVVDFIIATLEGRAQKDDPKDMRYFEDKEVQNMEDSLMDHPNFRTSGPTRDSVAYDKGLKDVN